MSALDVVKQLVGLLLDTGKGIHHTVRQILGDSEEARITELGFYLMPLGWSGMSVSQFFGLNPGLWALIFVFGILATVLGLSALAKKHKIAD